MNAKRASNERKSIKFDYYMETVISEMCELKDKDGSRPVVLQAYQTT
jgi:hypothetical protein